MILTKKEVYIALAAALSLSGCSGKIVQDKDTEFGRISVETEESMESVTTETYSSLLPDGFTKETETLPESAEQNTDDREGYYVKDIPSMRISISLPAGSEYQMTDKYNAAILCDGVIYYLHKFYNANFQNASEISGGAKTVLKSTNILYYDNEECSPTVYTPGGVKVITTEKGFDIAQESPYMVLFQENTMHAYEPNVDVSYMLFQGEAYMLFAVYDSSRTEVTSDAVKSVEADILSSMQYYAASEERDAVALSEELSVGNGITMNIPGGWIKSETERNAAEIIYSAPEGSLYSGTSVYVYMDKANKHSADSVSLPTAITNEYLKMLYKIDSEQLDSSETVLNFRQDEKGDYKFSVFDIKETLTPKTMDGIYYFPPEGNELYSLRCGFEDLNGDPGVVILNYTRDNEKLIYSLFTEIENTISFAN